MEAFVQRMLSDYFSVFVVGFRPEQLGFKMTLVSGQSSELRDLDFDCERLNALMGSEHFRLTRCHVNFLKVELSITRLKSRPVSITIDKVTMEWEEVDDVTAANAMAQHERLVAEVIDTFPTTERKPSKYGQFEHAIDGMSLVINHVVVKSTFKGSSELDATALVFDIRGLQIENSSALWRPIDTIDFKKRNGKVQIFKLCTCSSMYAWLQPVSTSKASHCHLLDGSPFTVHISAERKTATSELTSLDIDIVLPEFQTILNPDQVSKFAQDMFGHAITPRLLTKSHIQCQVLVNFVVSVSKCLLRTTPLQSNVSVITGLEEIPPPPTSPPPLPPPTAAVSSTTNKLTASFAPSQDGLLHFKPNIQICFRIEKSTITLLYPQDFTGQTNQTHFGESDDTGHLSSSIGVEFELNQFSFTKFFCLSREESSEQVAMDGFQVKVLCELEGNNLHLLSLDGPSNEHSITDEQVLAQCIPIPALVLPFEYAQQVQAAYDAQAEQHAFRIRITKNTDPRLSHLHRKPKVSKTLHVRISQLLCELNTIEVFRMVEFLDQTMGSEWLKAIHTTTSQKHDTSEENDELLVNTSDKAQTTDNFSPLWTHCFVFVSHFAVLLPSLGAFLCPAFQFEVAGLTLSRDLRIDASGQQQTLDWNFEVQDVTLAMLPWGSFAQLQQLIGPIAFSGMASVPSVEDSNDERDYTSVVNVIVELCVIRFHYLFIAKLIESMTQHLDLLNSYVGTLLKQSSHRATRAAQMNKVQIVIQTQLIQLHFYAHEGDLPEASSRSRTSPKSPMMALNALGMGVPASPSRRTSTTARALFEVQCSGIVVEVSNTHHAPQETSNVGEVHHILKRRGQVRASTVAVIGRDTLRVGHRTGNYEPYIILTTQDSSCVGQGTTSMFSIEVEYTRLLNQNIKVEKKPHAQCVVSCFNMYFDVRPEQLQHGFYRIIDFERYNWDAYSSNKSPITKSSTPASNVSNMLFDVKLKVNQLSLSLAGGTSLEGAKPKFRGLLFSLDKLSAGYTFKLQQHFIHQVNLHAEHLALLLQHVQRENITGTSAASQRVQVIQPFDATLKCQKHDTECWESEVSTTISPLSFQIDKQSLEYVTQLVAQYNQLAKSKLLPTLGISSNDAVLESSAGQLLSAITVHSMKVELTSPAEEELTRPAEEETNSDAVVGEALASLRQHIAKVEAQCPATLTAWKHVEQQWVMYLANVLEKVERAEDGRLAALSKSKVDRAGWVRMRTGTFGKRRKLWMVLNFGKLFFYTTPSDTEARLVLEIRKYHITHYNFGNTKEAKVEHSIVLTLLSTEQPSTSDNSTAAAISLAKKLSSKSKHESVVLVCESATEKNEWFSALSLLTSVLPVQSSRALSITIPDGGSENVRASPQVNRGRSETPTKQEEEEESTSPVQRKAMKFTQSAFSVAAKARSRAKLFTEKVKNELNERSTQVKLGMQDRSTNPNEHVAKSSSLEVNTFALRHGSSDGEDFGTQSDATDTEEYSTLNDERQMIQCTSCTYLNNASVRECSMCGSTVLLQHNNQSDVLEESNGVKLKPLTYEHEQYLAATEVLSNCSHIANTQITRLSELVGSLSALCSNAYWATTQYKLELAAAESSNAVSLELLKAELQQLKCKEVGWKSKFERLADQNISLHQQLGVSNDERISLTHQLDKSRDSIMQLQREVESMRNMYRLREQVEAVNSETEQGGKHLQEIAHRYMELLLKSEEEVNKLKLELSRMSKEREEHQTSKIESPQLQRCETCPKQVNEKQELQQEIERLKAELNTEKLQSKSKTELLNNYHGIITTALQTDEQNERVTNRYGTELRTALEEVLQSALRFDHQ